MERGEFIKMTGAYLAGKAVVPDSLIENFESNIFPEIQNNLRGTPWKGKNSFDSVRKKYYLTNEQWSNKSAPQEERTRIRESFYRLVDSLADKHAKNSGIEKDIYIMMAAKESNFGTSFLAQIAGNPFSINTVGKESVLPMFTSTIKWNDDGTEYQFYQFKNLNEAFDAFDKLIIYWKNKSEFARKQNMTNEQVIHLLARPHTWGAGKNGTLQDYNDWLKRVQKRIY